MAFFDDLSKSFSQAAESGRLNSAISEEEKKISSLYTQLGQRYVSLHGANPDPALAEYIRMINLAQNNIEIYKKQIAELKKVLRCTNCGAEIPNNSSFCMCCGTPAPKEATMPDVNTIVCSVCGNRVTRGMKFCTKCGNKMPEIPSTPVAPVVEPAPVAPVEPVPVAPVEPVPVAPVVEPAPVAPVEPVPVAPVVEPVPVAPVEPVPVAPVEPVPVAPVEPVPVAPAVEPVPVAPDIPEIPKISEPVFEPELSAPISVKCFNCGADVEADSNFCTQCGTRVKY